MEQIQAFLYLISIHFGSEFRKSLGFIPFRDNLTSFLPKSDTLDKTSEITSLVLITVYYFPWITSWNVHFETIIAPSEVHIPASSQGQSKLQKIITLNKSNNNLSPTALCYITLLDNYLSVML